MELNICHLYPDLMNVYGDLGNILILKYRSESRGIIVNVSNITIGDPLDPSKYDIVFFGGGQDYEQSIVSNDLMDDKKEPMRDFIESGKVLLAICGGYQLLGKYYTTPLGEKLDGLNILPIYTEPGNIRFIGNTIIEDQILGNKYVGFENHSGRTYIGDLNPLGKVLVGFGNNGEDGFEGCVYKNTYCTYFHGSFLSKNPDMADILIKKALELKYGEVSLEKLNDEFELKAREFILKKIPK